MNSSPGKILLSVVTIVVLGSIVAGVILVGGPTTGRLERFDKARIEDLQGIMQAIDRFRDDHERLPETLEELAEDPRARVNTLDPASAGAYEYAILNDDTYRLCAVFDGESRSRRRASAEFWSHDRGRQCFDLEAKTAADPPTESRDTAGALADTRAQLLTA